MRYPASFTYPDLPSGKDGADPNEIDVVKRILEYVTAQRWVIRILSYEILFSIPGVISLASVRFEPEAGVMDDVIWVVGGDLPFAYFVTDRAKNSREALSVYVELMESWATSVKEHRGLSDVFPVAAAPTLENANSLIVRTKFIRDNFIEVPGRVPG